MTITGSVTFLIEAIRSGEIIVVNDKKSLTLDKPLHKARKLQGVGFEPT